MRKIILASVTTIVAWAKNFIWRFGDELLSFSVVWFTITSSCFASMLCYCYFNEIQLFANLAYIAAFVGFIGTWGLILLSIIFQRHL